MSDKERFKLSAIPGTVYKLETLPGAEINVKVMTLGDREAIRIKYRLLEGVDIPEGITTPESEEKKSVENIDWVSYFMKTMIIESNIDIDDKPIQWTPEDIVRIPCEAIDEITRILTNAMAPLGKTSESLK
jgi:hypothetical protein